jgi:hypothetical protein
MKCSLEETKKMMQSEWDNTPESTPLSDIKHELFILVKHQLFLPNKEARIFVDEWLENEQGKELPPKPHITNAVLLVEINGDSKLHNLILDDEHKELLLDLIKRGTFHYEEVQIESAALETLHL